MFLGETHDGTVLSTLETLCEKTQKKCSFPLPTQVVKNVHFPLPYCKDAYNCRCSLKHNFSSTNVKNSMWDL